MFQSNSLLRTVKNTCQFKHNWNSRIGILTTVSVTEIKVKSRLFLKRASPPESSELTSSDVEKEMFYCTF